MLKQILILAVSLVFTFAASAQPMSSADTYFAYGKKMSNEGRYPDAVRAFRKVTELNKNYDSAYIEWSIVYAKMNKPDSALIVLTKAIKIKPKMIAAYLTMGKIYRDNKSNYDSALISFYNAFKIDSANLETIYNISWCYNAKQDYDNAISYAAKALSLDINYKPAYNEMAHAYHASKKYNEGIEQFKKYIGISTCDLPLYYSGLCYLELNQSDNVQKMIDELNKTKSKLGESLKRRWDMKKNIKPAQPAGQ
jgi:tetratricopeptide (TPR) repeat protein